MEADARDLLAAAQSLTELWSPRVVAELNGQYVKVAKVQGEFVWHDHADQDEMFLVLDGCFHIELRDRTVRLDPGQIFVVPRGVEHRPFAPGICCIALFEPVETRHTGDVVTPLSRGIDEQRRALP